MAANRLVLSIPLKKVSAWITETEPKAAREWLDSLPMADMAEASREIYQALYSLNRLDMGPSERIKLMELYRQPVATVTKSLQSHFQASVLPLNQKKRQLAEFIRELQSEMAYGYKNIVRGLSESRVMWGKKKLNSVATAGALFYLGEILNKSYQVYMPCPPGVWQEVHALYRYAERQDFFGESIELQGHKAEGMSAPYLNYLQIVLLGLCNPYQLPEKEWQRIQEFLKRWGHKAIVHSNPGITNPAGQFLIDLSDDSPPATIPKDINIPIGGNYRVLNALGVSRVVQDFIVRLRAGESARNMDMGMECLDTACLDILSRMIKFWGTGVRRKRPRKKKQGIGLVAYGVHAIHFFSGNQKPFDPPERPESSTSNPFDSLMDRVTKEDSPLDLDSAFIDLDQLNINDNKKSSVSEKSSSYIQEVYRVERWKIEDESIGGLFLTHASPDSHRLKVGEILGLQDVSRDDSWRVGVVRWLKTPSKKDIQMGVEMLAPGITPVSARLADEPLSSQNPFVQALLLSPVSALRLPASLILPQGLCKPEQALLLAVGDEKPRRIIALRVLSQTATFEQYVFADAAH